MICPEYREKYFNGLERVDSLSFNPHKGLLVNFDCCAAWFADATYLKRALSLTPVFLQGMGNQLDLKDWQVRGLRAWLERALNRMAGSPWAKI